MARLFSTPLLLVASLLVVSGCGLETSSPVPQPVPGLVRISTLSVTEPAPQPERLLVGLPGAVDGAGQVVVQELQSGLQVTLTAAEGGSFSGVLQLGAEARLMLRFRDARGTSDPVPLQLARPLGPLPTLSPSNTFGDVVSTPDAQGLVTVTNEDAPGQPPLIDASPGVEVLVSNSGTGQVVSSSTDAKGLFSVQLAAQVGQTIHILLVDPQSSDLTSDFLSYTVPQV